MSARKPRCADCGHAPAKGDAPLVQHGDDMLCHRADHSCHGRRLALGGDTYEQRIATVEAAIAERRGVFA